MAVPVIATTTEDDSAGGKVNTLTINKPTGTVENDLLLLIGGDDETINANFGFDVIAGGWVEDFDEGDGTSDSGLNFQHLVAGASEPGTYTWNKTNTETDEMWAWTARITGINTTTPIDVTGAVNISTSNAPKALEVTTTVADCLVIAAHAFDGGDLHPTTVSGTGWTEESERTSGTGDVDAGGTVASKSQATVGLTVDCDFSTNLADGWVAAQIAIAGAAAGGANPKGPLGMPLHGPFGRPLGA